MTTSNSQELKALLAKIRTKYPTSWFLSSYVKAKIVDLKALEEAGYLEASKFRGNQPSFRLRKDHSDDEA